MVAPVIGNIDVAVAIGFSPDAELVFGNLKLDAPLGLALELLDL